jgi:branched-chain amino acid transport system permease protein
MYLAVVTLSVAYAFPPLVLKFDWLTGGVNGKGPGRTGAKLVPPSWMPFADAGRLARPLWVYCISIVVATALFVLARNFINSRPGRALIAVRDNEASALSVGINVSMYRGLTFGVSAVYGGLAGSLLMMNRPFASDVQFGTTVAIFLVVGLVVGGSGSISGAIPGAFVYLFVPYFVSEWTFDQSGMPPGLRQVAAPLFDVLSPGGGAAVGIVFGLALVLLMFVMPGGFVAAMRRLRARIITVVPRPSWLAEVRPHGRDG